MTYNIPGGAIRWQIPDFLSDSNSNVCTFQRLLVKIAALKCNLENLGKSQGIQFLQ